MHNLIAQRLWNPALNTTIGNLYNPGDGTTVIQMFMSNIMTFLFGLAVVILMVMILIGAYEYITAGGDKEALSRSTKRMTQAVIGLLILFSIYLIAQVIGVLFGINVLQVNIPLLTS